MTKLVATLLKALNVEGNRAPDWIEVLPAGTPEGEHRRITGSDSRTWIIKDTARIVADSDRHGPVHVDYEHASEVLAPKGGEAPAAGWVAELQPRADGSVWARVEWTPRAAAMVVAREYRFVSPVFVYDQNTGEVLWLVSVALTNRPNLKMTALNRQGSADPAQPAPEAKPKDTSTMTPEQHKALCRKLGLADEASVEAIMSAVATLQDDKATALNRAETPDLKKFVPRADYDAAVAKATTAETALNTIQTERREAEYVALVDGAVAAGKVPPASKGFYLAMCRKGGVDEVKQFIGSTPSLTGGSGLDKKDPAGPAAAGTLTTEEKAMCTAMGLTEDAYLKNKAA